MYFKYVGMCRSCRTAKEGCTAVEACPKVRAKKIKYMRRHICIIERGVAHFLGLCAVEAVSLQGEAMAGAIQESLHLFACCNLESGGAAVWHDEHEGCSGLVLCMGTILVKGSSMCAVLFAPLWRAQRSPSP